MSKNNATVSSTSKEPGATAKYALKGKRGAVILIALVLVVAMIVICSISGVFSGIKQPERGDTTAKQAIKTAQAPAAIGPYSQGIRVGNLFYSSGQIPADPVSGDIVPGGIVEQATRSFENVKAVLEEAGLSFDKVVKVNVFMQNLEDFAAMNELYEKYFTEPFPARSCVQIAALPKGALIEVEVIAEV